MDLGTGLFQTLVIAAPIYFVTQKLQVNATHHWSSIHVLKGLNQKFLFEINNEGLYLLVVKRITAPECVLIFVDASMEQTGDQENQKTATD